MGKRILVAVVMIPVLLAVIFLLPDWVLAIGVTGLSMIAIHEVLWSTGFVKDPKISGLSIALAGLIPLWVFFTDQDPWLGLAGAFLYVTALFAVAMASNYTVTMEKMGGSFFLTALIPYFLSSFLRLRALPEWRAYILLPFVVAWLSDAFALFAGMAFGKHKLAPQLSPKKTVEGAVGGLAGAVVFTLLYGLIVGRVLGFSQVRYGVLAVYALLGALISQFGDLAFSYIKRQYHIKDYGNIFPGHGGVLDRFDSVIFCVPLIELLVGLCPVFGA
ncbi:phosphatidate cytidylyltransferase [uncultured Intestinimonas sp.]|uniref:phosphatidate cytidylyltransferase n=1 Tax=uncultured Intestinimonas sp. TaxID=1689265 RepID=UPI0025DBD042|nr:phosphatidate cytidylyltransferase [uncultured Intestinimonas sp.]